MQPMTARLAQWLWVPLPSGMWLAPVWGLILATACGPQGGVESSRADASGSVNSPPILHIDDAGPIIVMSPDGRASDGQPAVDRSNADIAMVGCGNGKIDPGLDEACDDGNSRSGDGCSSDCKTIEKDYICPLPGAPCEYLVSCGDGRVGGKETTTATSSRTTAARLIAR